MRTRPVNLHILDKDYIIACPTEQCEDLLASAEYLTKKMQEVRESGKVVSTERIAVMAALNIVHELLNCPNKQSIELRLKQLNPELIHLEEKLTRALEQFAPVDVR